QKVGIGLLLEVRQGGPELRKISEDVDRVAGVAADLGREPASLGVGVGKLEVYLIGVALRATALDKLVLVLNPFAGNAFLCVGCGEAGRPVLLVRHEIEHRLFPVVVVVAMVEFAAGDALGLRPFAFVAAGAPEPIGGMVRAEQLGAVGMALRPDRIVV